MFSDGMEYTRDEIHLRVGGSKQTYLPTRQGSVVAACLKLDLNPNAPYVILCGKGTIIASAGVALSVQREPIPVFIKRGVNRWEYQGLFKVTEAHSSGAIFTSLITGSGRALSDVSLAIKLGKCN